MQWRFAGYTRKRYTKAGGSGYRLTVARRSLRSDPYAKLFITVSAPPPPFRLCAQDLIQFNAVDFYHVMANHVVSVEIEGLRDKEELYADMLDSGYQYEEMDLEGWDVWLSCRHRTSTVYVKKDTSNECCTNLRCTAKCHSGSSFDDNTFDDIPSM